MTEVDAGATKAPLSAITMSRLTERQRDCLKLLARGYRIKEIAIQLGNSPETVKQHLAAARKSLNAPTSAQAARAFVAWEQGEPRTTQLIISETASISGESETAAPPPKEVNPPQLLADHATSEPSLQSSRAWRRWLGPLGWLIPAYRGAPNELSTARRAILLIILPLVMIMITVGALSSFETLVRLLHR